MAERQEDDLLAFSLDPLVTGKTMALKLELKKAEKELLQRRMPRACPGFPEQYQPVVPCHGLVATRRVVP